MLGHRPREPLLLERLNIQGVGQGTGYRVHVQGRGLQWVAGHLGGAEGEGIEVYKV